MQKKTAERKYLLGHTVFENQMGFVNKFMKPVYGGKDHYITYFVFPPVPPFGIPEKFGTLRAAKAHLGDIESL